MAEAMQPQILQLIQSLIVKGIWVWPRGAIQTHLDIAKNDMSRFQFLSTLKSTGKLTDATHAKDIESLIDWI